MQSRLYNALYQLSKIRAFFILLVVFALRAWRKIPTLRPHQMAMPAAILQVVVFMLAAITPEQFMFRFAAGNFIIFTVLMLPVVLQPAEVKVHWVRPEE